LPTLVNAYAAPAEALVDVVATHGADPTGVADSTTAIRNAIAAAQPVPGQPTGYEHRVYFPDGVYRVTDTIEWKSGSTYGSNIVLQGTNQGRVTLKLDNGASGFGNAGSPKPVLFMAAANTTVGNIAFRNFVRDMTIDCGNNVGAVGVDFLANNQGGLRRVTIKGNGVYGISAMRGASGNAFNQRVTIEGFQYGFKSDDPEYSLTFEHLKLINQTVAGFTLSYQTCLVKNVISRQRGDVPAFLIGRDGMLSVIDADLPSTGGTYAINNTLDVNSSTLYLRNIRSSGYTYKLRSFDPNAGSGTAKNYTPTDIGDTDEFITTSVKTLFPAKEKRSLNLPLPEAPQCVDTDTANWTKPASIVFVTSPNSGSADQASKIQTALNSGAHTIYLLGGPLDGSVAAGYAIKTPMTIPGTVKRIVGFGAKLFAVGWPTGANMFTVLDETDDPLFIDDLMTSGLGTISGAREHVLEHAARRPLVIRDSQIGSAYFAQVAGRYGPKIPLWVSTWSREQRSTTGASIWKRPPRSSASRTTAASSCASDSKPNEQRQSWQRTTAARPKSSAGSTTWELMKASHFI
jgi:hypothetical protein